jgi:hypothetical protein
MGWNPHPFFFLFEVDMPIITDNVGLANFAGGVFGGFGDQFGGSGQLTSLDGTDKITAHVNTYMPFARQAAIKQLAQAGLPFRETFKFADLGEDLKQYDIAIESITGGGATVTVVTQDDHEFVTGDKLILTHLEGDSTIEALNNAAAVTITVVDDTTFTFASTATGTHTADTGIASLCPEMGSWQYAFNLPADFLEIVGQYDESSIPKRTNFKSQYQTQTILNAAGTGYLLLTNNVSNQNGDSAYIGYVIDSTTYSMWTLQLVKCAAYLLAELLCPVCGRDSKEAYWIRQQYEKEILPMAKRMNTAQINDHKPTTIDYTGGRSIGSPARLKNSLGTYIDAQGNRRAVY